ncbi:hypothetical protein Vretifemale_16050 [Volvox reticuliferus]|uniref:Uncharacterized protein n=3 Tax=Volvox reticuliferus TaxID=1737510 RepID=A0A8J4FVT7_9CHLO|nr:hypothetical protein Vretifemale_16050 [Volvox reticuliferus]
MRPTTAGEGAAFGPRIGRSLPFVHIHSTAYVTSTLHGHARAYQRQEMGSLRLPLPPPSRSHVRNGSPRGFPPQTVAQSSYVAYLLAMLLVHLVQKLSCGCFGGSGGSSSAGVVSSLSTSAGYHSLLSQRSTVSVPQAARMRSAPARLR